MNSNVNFLCVTSQRKIAAFHCYSNLSLDYSITQMTQVYEEV